MRKLPLLIAGIVLAWTAPSPPMATARPAGDDMERRTHYGPVVGVDDSRHSGTLCVEGHPLSPSRRSASCAGSASRTRALEGAAAATQFGNACVRTARIYGPRQQPLRPEHRHHAGPGSGQRGLPVPEHLGTGGPARAPPATMTARMTAATTAATANGNGNGNGNGRLPVIVFVHGGSNVSGYTADPVYDGAALARAANAVVVTVNYRLGIFGFFNLPQLKSGSDAQEDSGNFALLDIIQALRFVRRDIDKFGGDPKNITLVGQSAGAINVYALLTTPATVQARPSLFHRAAPLSGGISLASNLPPGRLPTLNPAAVYLAQGNQLLSQQLIVDGVAADAAAAAAWVASHAAAGGGVPAHAHPAQLLTTLLTRLAPLAWPARPDPGRRHAAHRSDLGHRRGPVPARAGTGRQHARRRQVTRSF